MKQKIEWYREVLALEPGSRVFFPLARLLASDGQLPAAVATLQQGILRHPDHVEARLLLIEFLLLAGNSPAAEGEAQELGRLLTAYPAFFGVWSEILSARPDMRDAGLALRVVSLALQGKQVSWGAIMEQGLAALTAAMSVVERAQPSASQPSPMVTRRMVMQPPTTVTVGKASVTPAQPAPVQEVAPSPLAPETVPLATDTIGVDEAENTSFKQEFPELAAQSADMPAKEEKENSPVSDTVEEKNTAVAESGAPIYVEDVDSFGDDEGEDEAFSIRTRTMAEILAEQGDFAGAADIYAELLAHAPEEEQEGLRQRMEEMQGRINTPATEAPADTAGQSTKLADLLESLAQRLENRAR